MFLFYFKSNQSLVFNFATKNNCFSCLLLCKLVLIKKALIRKYNPLTTSIALSFIEVDCAILEPPRRLPYEEWTNVPSLTCMEFYFTLLFSIVVFLCCVFASALLLPCALSSMLDIGSVYPLSLDAVFSAVGPNIQACFEIAHRTLKFTHFQFY